MARGRTGPVVSLFAFQDIITAVSGILIVIVLLLALELVEQPEASASSSSAQAEKVAAALASSEAELEALKVTLQAESESVRDAAGTSAEALEQEIRDLELESQRVESQLQSLAEESRELKEAQASLEVKQFDAAETTAELQAERKRVEDLREAITSAQSDDRVVFTLPQGLSKSGWLVVIEDEIMAAPLGEEARPTTYDSVTSFLAWSEGQPGNYFLLLIRPSGIDNFDRIDDAFRQSSVTYGFDVVGSQAKLLHPERGAAP